MTTRLIRPSRSRIGTDIGGTFTDAAAIDAQGRLRLGKTLTTPRREVDGVLGAVRASGVPLAEADLFVHGTTMVINALLERRGVRTAIVTTQGFADVVALGRGNRPEIFNPYYRRDPELVTKELRLEIDERMTADGVPLRAPRDEDIDRVIAELRAKDVQAVAVAFLHSYKNPAHEQRVAERLMSGLPGLFVTASSALASQWREFERFTTACANAYVGPLVKRYVSQLGDGLRHDGFRGDALYLDAGGGAVGGGTVSAYPIRLIESGPVGGVVGAAAIAARLGLRNVVTLDIGGTTAKSCLIEEGRFETLEEYWVGGYERGLPVQVPVIDIHEVGAGGGSIAWLDEGRLRVGPRSAGAEPGPAAYGRGGSEPAVTDALVYCGLLHPDCFLADIALDAGASAAAVEKLAKASGLTPQRLALGILELANTSVATAVRRQTLERGRDPREFTMVVSGGCGPALACDVADLVGIPDVLIPPSPGHFSAIGMLSVDLRFSGRAVIGRLLEELPIEELQAACERTRVQVAKGLAAELSDTDELRAEYAVGLRYSGQDHHLRVPLPTWDAPKEATLRAALRASFSEIYQRRYGYVDEESALEVVDVEVVVTRDLPPVGELLPEPEEVLQDKQVSCLFAGYEAAIDVLAVHRPSLHPGRRLEGPLLVYERGSIVVVPPGWSAEKVSEGNLLLQRRAR